jgi:hypothetical protein
MSGEATMIKVAGKRFFCDCGCNVFTKLDDDDELGTFYKCNGCGVMWA